ncbi:MAG: DUF167 domain-containing protein [Anaerolineae bacterium]|jgi:uncharacterized protein (TIGR00251 family)
MPDPVSFRLRVRVTPRGGRDEVIGYRDGVLLVRLKAPPVEGAANEALVAFLAKQLSLPKSALELARGHRSRDKEVTGQGLDDAEALRRLGVSSAP